MIHLLPEFKFTSTFSDGDMSLEFLIPKNTEACINSSLIFFFLFFFFFFLFIYLFYFFLGGGGGEELGVGFSNVKRMVLHSIQNCKSV